MSLSNVRSSLPLEVLLYINSRYSILFYFSIIGIYFYKMSLLDYPIHVEVPELIIIFLFAPIEALRIYWAHRGNLTESAVYIMFSLLLGVAICTICIYLAFFQGYVMLLEQILLSVQAGLTVSESIFKMATIASFSRSSITLVK